MSTNYTKQPSLGFGLGLRTEHYDDIIATQPQLDWLEVISENYLCEGGKPLRYLHQIREMYPMVMHGVSMSVGSTDPLDTDYLARLKKLANDLDVPWFSDHLCWTGVAGKNMHDLLPLPYTDEAVRHVAQRIEQVMDFMQRPMIIENLSSYITYTDSAMSEWQFYQAVVEEANCGMLLDINNIYVSAQNHDFDAMAYLDSIPVERVQQFHLAGHDDSGEIIVDTHDHPIKDAVWDLYAAAVKRFGHVSTMIERDDNIPPLEEVLGELATAKSIALPILKAA